MSSLLLVTIVMAADDNTPHERRQHRLWVDYYQQSAAAYEFKSTKDGSPKFEVTPKPIHKYTHPNGLKGTHGALFVWAHQGRPEVVGSIWSYEIGGGKRNVVHEFHSLSLRPLAPVRIGDQAWSPKVAGITMEPFPRDPPPVSNSRLRLAQMRSLAREFRGFSRLESKEVPLRLLPQPLFRYSIDAPQVIDGAVFGLFNDWDPEIILMIEARNTENGPQWHFAAARFNICPLRLQHRSEDVWRVDQGVQKGGRFGDPDGAFFAVHAVEVRESSFPD
jgi:hypothetical protein